MKFGSVCSGIEAASVAWHPLGWSAAWLAEIESFPSAVLQHHYPGVPNLGDMTQIAHLVRDGFVEAPDILVGGTPCQSFSIAGLRNSMSDSRGQLTLSFVDLANAIDTTRFIRGEPAAIIVWENVPGVLNTPDNAFGCFLGALAGEDEELQPAGKRWSNAGCVFGPQRAIAWRVIDAQYFGVAQRRRRVFVVASARDGFDPSRILFEFDGVRRDIAPSRGEKEETSGALTSSLGRRGGIPDCGSNPGLLQPVDTHRMVAFGEYVQDGTASTMKMRDYKDATYPVAYGIPGNWIGRAPENGGNATEPMHDVAPCQTKTDRHGIATTPFDIAGTMLSGTRGPSIDHAASGYMALHDMQVRRLTPIECARLQGFPDTYLDIQFKNKPAANSHKYKALGNSMAVPCMEWIGTRIKDYMKENL